MTHEEYELKQIFKVLSEILKEGEMFTSVYLLLSSVFNFSYHL